MSQYFIHDGYAQQGPFTMEQLQSQQLTPETPVWYEGLEKWATIGSLPDLKSLLLKKSAPPPLIPVFNSNAEQSEDSKKASYATAMEQYFPTENRKSLRIPVIIGSIVLAAVIIFWLINNNKQNSETISNLQNEITVQRQQDDQKKELAERINNALNQKNLQYRSNWDRFITETHGEPKINYSLGGISEFQVRLSNQTEYILDQVDIRVQYIRKNEDVWQTKDISFFNVSANSYETKIAPSSINGVKVKVAIQKIICKKMNFCYPTGGGNIRDPYNCL